MEFHPYNFATNPSHLSADIPHSLTEGIIAYEQSNAPQFAVDKSMLRKGTACTQNAAAKLNDPSSQHAKNVLEDGLVCTKPINSHLYGCYPAGDVAPRSKADAPSFHRTTGQCLRKCHSRFGPLAPEYSADVPKSEQLCVVDEHKIDPAKFDAALTGLNELWPLVQTPVQPWAQRTNSGQRHHALQTGHFTQDNDPGFSSYLDNQSADSVLVEDDWGWSGPGDPNEQFLRLSG